MNRKQFYKYCVIFIIITLTGCESDSESKDNRPSFYLVIENSTTVPFSCKYVEYNENYQYVVGQNKYEHKTVEIAAMSSISFTAYPNFELSEICEVDIGYNGEKKGLVFFYGDVIRKYKILPGLLGSPGSG